MNEMICIPLMEDEIMMRSLCFFHFEDIRMIDLAGDFVWSEDLIWIYTEAF